MRRPLAILALGIGIAACAPPKNAGPIRNTLVIGLDVSGSFRKSGHFEDALDFAALYLYGHLRAMGDLRQPSAVFVGSLGGERPGEPKTFHPIQDLSGKSPEEIAADLRRWFPETDPLTDFNAFFQRVAVHVKRQNLVLAPLNIVMFSDGVPDIPGGHRMTADSLYRRIDLSPLEYLSRSVTVRLLYATPSVAQNWERRVPRKRVRVWTQDTDVMQGWRRHWLVDITPVRQDSLWSWIDKIVDFRVRRGRIL